ncbi:MAG: hypothetical protein ACNA8P_06950, partial [Phycisphaerales bacterium]
EPYARQGDPMDVHDPGMRWQLDHLSDQSQRLQYRPSRDNWGPVTVPAGAELTVSAEASFFNSINNQTKFLINEGTVRRTGSGSTTFTSSNGPGVLDNRATVIIESGELSHDSLGGRNAGTITVENGGVLRLGSTFTHEPTSTIQGDGTVVFQGGTHSFGILSPDQYSRVDLAGTLSLAGTLAVAVDPKYQPKLGDEFPIIRAGQVTGAFANSINLNLGGGLSLISVIEADGGLTLRVVSQ